MSDATIVVPNSSVAIVVSLEQTVAFPRIDGFLQKFVVHFDDVKFERNVFRLRSPLELTLAKVKGGWTCQESSLSLFGFGVTHVASVISVFEDFSVLWSEIAQAPDDTLSGDAVELKKLMLSLVQSVEES